MTPQAFKYDNLDSEQSEAKRFLSRRLGPNIDPTKVSAFKFGDPEFDLDVKQAILKNTRSTVDKHKV
jgi:hypothetical protein